MKRIQRKRTKGWRIPENTIYVGRPSKWGNPIKLEGDCIFIDAGYRRKIFDRWVYYRLGFIDDVLHIYELILQGTPFVNKDLQYWSDKFKENNIIELKGKNLACFCPLNKPCHADILLKYANK